MAIKFEFKIHKYDELPSTNSYARGEADAGAPEGDVYVADYQTGGRGQFDRKWVSPRGKNLLFSVLLRPPIKPNQAPMITQIACRSVAQVLEEIYQIPCTIKKPNDVLWNKQKICGILVESSSASPKKLQDVIIGIGLNVNEAPEGLDIPAASMKSAAGREFDRDDVLTHILAQLKKDLEKLYASAV